MKLEIDQEIDRINATQNFNKQNIEANKLSILQDFEVKISKFMAITEEKTKDQKEMQVKFETCTSQMKITLDESIKIIKQNEVNLKEISHNLEQKEKILSDVINNSVK